MFAEPLRDVSPDIGSAEISDTNDSKTKRLAKSAVVISFIIEALLGFPVYIDLLDVG